MKIRALFTALCLCCMVLTAQASVPAGMAVQVGTYDSLYAGVYDGIIKVGDLMDDNTIGLGTFHALDGEMVILNGVLYQIKGSGNVVTPRTSITSPFMTAISFSPDINKKINSPTSFEAMRNFIDNLVPELKIPLAMRIHGNFSYIKVRSFVEQKKPYTPLEEIIKTQAEFEKKNITGTLVGFRFPISAKGANALGYHFHFISDDKKFGGHVMEFTVDSAIIDIEDIHELHILFPHKDL